MASLRTMSGVFVLASGDERSYRNDTDAGVFMTASINDAIG